MRGQRGGENVLLNHRAPAVSAVVEPAVYADHGAHQRSSLASVIFGKAYVGSTSLKCF